MRALAAGDPSRSSETKQQRGRCRNERGQQPGRARRRGAAAAVVVVGVAGDRAGVEHGRRLRRAVPAAATVAASVSAAVSVAAAADAFPDGRRPPPGGHRAARPSLDHPCSASDPRVGTCYGKQNKAHRSTEAPRADEDEFKCS